MRLDLELKLYFFKVPIKQGTKRFCFNHWIKLTQPQLLKPWKRSSRYYTETFHSETGWSCPNSPKKIEFRCLPGYD